MARYLYADLRTFLQARGCWTEGDAFGSGLGWYTSDCKPFTLPLPNDGWVDAEVIELILRDQWICAGVIPLKRYPDAGDQEGGSSPV